MLLRTSTQSSPGSGRAWQPELVKSGRRGSSMRYASCSPPSAAIVRPPRTCRDASLKGPSSPVRTGGGLFTGDWQIGAPAEPIAARFLCPPAAAGSSPYRRRAGGSESRTKAASMTLPPTLENCHAGLSKTESPHPENASAQRVGLGVSMGVFCASLHDKYRDFSKIHTVSGSLLRYQNP